MTDDSNTEQMNGQERPRLSLQRRLGVILSRNDTNVSSDELRSLIQEVTNEAAKLEETAQRLHDQTLDINCDDPAAAKEAEKEAALTRQRLLIANSRAEERLRLAIIRERSEVHQSDFLRVEAKVAEAAQRWIDRYPVLIAELIALFQEAKTIDAEVDRVNANAMGGERLQYVELAARHLDRHTRENPSLAGTVLFDFKTGEQVWPPRQIPMSVLVAQSMIPAPNIAHSDRWFEAVGERRAEIEAQNARTADYHARQEQERLERQAQEDALAAAERQRSGYP